MPTNDTIRIGDVRDGVANDRADAIDAICASANARADAQALDLVAARALDLVAALVRALARVDAGATASNDILADSAELVRAIAAADARAHDLALTRDRAIALANDLALARDRVIARAIGAAKIHFTTAPLAKLYS